MENILHLSKHYPPFLGGTEIYMKYLAKGLANKGYRNHVITSDALVTDIGIPFSSQRSGIERVPTERETTKGVTINRLPFTFFQNRFEEYLEQAICYVLRKTSQPVSSIISRVFQDPVGVKMLYDGISRNPDIIHASSVTDSSIASAVILGIYHDVPSVIRPAWHIGNQGYKFKEWKKTFELSDQIIVATEQEKEFFVKNGIDTSNIETIGYGVEFDQINTSRAISDIESEEFTVLTMSSRADEGKGIPQVMEVAKKISDVKFLLAGPESEFGHINTLPENCEYIGELAGEEKHRVLNSVDTFLLPSVAESFGIVYIEAMSAGLPVITADIPICKELYSQTGLQVEHNDVDAIKEAVLSLRDNTDQSRKCSKNAKEIARQYSWEQIVNQTERAWLKLFQDDTS